MLNNNQLAKLEEFEHFVMELLGSREYQILAESDYSPDIGLADISQGIAEVLDYHVPSQPIRISPNFQKLFSDRQLSKKLTSIDFDEFESLNNF